MEGGFVVVNGGEKSINNNNNNNTDNETMEQLNLPPGFRFHPTDEEVISHYLVPKVLDSNFTATAMGEVDLNRNEPWDLPTKAKMGDKEWYFFCQRDRKYPTGMRTNRATESGYWKATGKDKEIYGKSRKGGGGHGSSSSSSKQLVGMKKTLVFYRGRAPKGEKLDWVMHEFRLEGNYSYYSFPKSAKDEWVVCRVIHRTTSVVMKPSSMLDITRMNSFIEGMLGSPSLPPLVDSPFLENDEKPDASTNVINGTSTTTTTTTTTSNVQEFSGASYPITTTMSSDGKTIYYHQLQMQPQNQNIPTSFNPINGDPISTNYSQRFDYTIPNSIRSEIKHINYQDRDQRHCNKVEHLSSNQSMISASKSQDTDLSTDHISSSSKQEENRGNVRHFNDIENHYVTSSLSDLDSFWS